MEAYNIAQERDQLEADLNKANKRIQELEQQLQQANKKSLIQRILNLFRKSST